MPAKGKWSATTTTEGTCAFHTLRKSSQLQSPPSRPPWPTPALWATSRRETAVWVGVWFVGSGGLEVDRWPQDERSLRMFMCLWLCKFIVGGHRLQGTGGRSRCWDWRQHVSAICVGVSEYESKGGRQTDRQTDSEGIWKISHENSCCVLRTGLAARNVAPLKGTEAHQPAWDSKHDSTWCDIFSCRVQMRRAEWPSSALQQEHCIFLSGWMMVCLLTITTFWHVCPCFTSPPQNTDIDECERDEHDCQPSQQCINSLGAFTCQCPDGYRKVGTECIGEIICVYLSAGLNMTTHK